MKLLKLLVSGVALSALAMTLLVSSLVLAAGPRVLLVGVSWSDPIVARMRDELGVLGFEVEIVVGNATTAELAGLARSRGAAAAARVDAAAPAIDLWVDPASEPGTVAELRIDGPGSPALLALRAVEVLRGRLIPSGPAPTPDAAASVDAEIPRAVPPPPPAAATLPAPAAAPAVAPPGPFALFLAPALLMSPGGLPTVPHVRLGAEWFPVNRVGVDLVTFLPTVSATVSAPEGSVALRILALGGGLHGTLTDPASELSLGVGLGLSGMLLVFDGEAAPPYVAERGSRWIASPYASIGAAYRAYPRLAIRAEMLAALAQPEPVLRIAEREVASFGQPAIFLSLGIEVRP